jgi:hypothetical protein
LNHVGEIIVERRIVTYDPREPILDDNLGETNVRVIIFNYLKDQSHIMSIWRWPLSQTILKGHSLSSLLATYDKHHVSEEDEKGVVGVKKKITF